ncbi:TonB-dependent receptor [Serratia marcescens]|uniref:TonB-dependent receptor n=1 Tax=Serratia marcescens TaxID=615 RepID=A0A939NKG8_SERMA|nr:TonB-dependent receptor [Serratia marcescens]
MDYGEKGDQRRNEKNRIWNRILPANLRQLTPHWTLDAGLRYSTVSFDSTDYYITPRNGDGSGSKRYHQWLPMGSLNYKISPAWNVYLSAGRGFETPTINELSYRPDGQTGLNIGLQPSTSDTVELGSKLRLGNGTVSAALFQTDTDNELVVAESSGGRTSYANAGKTGGAAELALDQSLRWTGACIWLDAAGRHLPQRYVRQSRLYPSPDHSRRQSPAGHRAQHGYASLAFAPPEGWHAGAELRYERHSGQRRQQRAGPRHTVAGVNAGYRFTRNRWALDVFSRVDACSIAVTSVR